tara:strand:+ start:39 stop:359 length:321 start_codon:yes stop_codon:yes gene_type:complete
MPTYKFRDMNTGKEFEEFMSMSERENYLKTHPTIAQLPVAVAFVGDHIMGVGPKNDEGFKERMSQIASAHPNSHLADRYKTGESHKSLRTKEVVRKHQKKNPLVTK